MIFWQVYNDGIALLYICMSLTLQQNECNDRSRHCIVRGEKMFVFILKWKLAVSYNNPADRVLQTRTIDKHAFPPGLEITNLNLSFIQKISNI